MPAIQPERLETEIEQGTFRPVYLFWGPEEYLLRRALSSLKSKALRPEDRAFNLAECSGQGCSVEEILEHAKTFPMMSARRLVLVTDADRLGAAALDRLADYAAAPQEKTVLVLIASTVDRRTTFYKRMMEHCGVVEFSKLKGAALVSWAEREFSRRRIRISSSAVRSLVDLAGSDMLSLENEIEKLALYAGKEKEIRDGVITEMIRGSRQHGVFELTAAVGKKDRRGALRLLGNLLEGGEPPLMILAMLARHFRQVIIVQELLAAGRAPHEIGRAALIPDFVLRDFLRQAREIDSGTAQMAFRRLSRIDLSFKSSNPDERMLLEHLICSL